MEKKPNKNIFFDSSGCFVDPIKSKLIKKLKEIYGEISLVSGGKSSFCDYILAQKIKDSDRVFIWNGTEYGCFWVKEICNQFQKKYCVFERGLVPQADSNFMVDATGIVRKACNLDPSKILKRDSSKQKLKELIKNQKKFWESSDRKKICFILQLNFDSTVYHYSPFASFEEMIDYVCFRDGVNQKDIVICPHPRDRAIKSKYKISKKSTVEECLDASVIYGLTSTILYELYYLGCPLKILGDHPLLKNWSEFEDPIICIFDNQFDISDDNEEIFEKIEYSCNL